MVTADGLAKIVDFGIARPPSAERSEVAGCASPAGLPPASTTVAGATVDGSISGTPNYMSPE